MSALTRFELAILSHIAERTPPLRPAIGHLRVARREFTGAGSYTYFEPTLPIPLVDGSVPLEALVSMPGVPHGMGAILSVASGQASCLEIFTYGESSWYGDPEGFVIAPAA